MSDSKIVPVEPTEEMLRSTGVHFHIAERIYNAMLASAPTQEVEPVGFRWRKKDSKDQTWRLCRIELLEGGEGIDHELLYTHPAPSELVKAAEEVLKAYEDGEETNLYNKMTDLRSALDKLK